MTHCDINQEVVFLRILYGMFGRTDGEHTSTAVRRPVPNAASSQQSSLPVIASMSDSITGVCNEERNANLAACVSVSPPICS